MKKFLAKILEGVEDSTGMVSSTRIAFLCWVFCFVAVWTALSIKTSSLMHIDTSLLYITGLFLTSKVGGSLVEAIPSQASSTIKTTTQTVQPAPQTIVTTEKTVTAPNNP